MTLTVAELHERLAVIPRVRLCELPTPLQPWPRLAGHWCPGVQIAAKRDDLAGPGFGGNKSRQLEFLLADALAAGADTVVHGGAVHSNYCRQLSAAAVAGAMRAAAERLGVSVPDGTIEAIDIRFEHVGTGGYAVPTREAMAALGDVARPQGVLLDPVYTGKAAAGLRGLLSPGRSSVLVHTGGAVAGFAYAPAIAATPEASRAG